jgi:hypothetical protein
MFGLSTILAMNQPPTDFEVSSRGPRAGCLFTPKTPDARAWLQTHSPYTEDYCGESLVVKHREVDSVIFDIRKAGLTAV